MYINAEEEDEKREEYQIANEFDCEFEIPTAFFVNDKPQK